MTMKRALFLLLALCGSTIAQVTNITVVADSSRVIRTNFTLGAAQISGSFAISNVTGLQTSLDSKLATNGSAALLNNFPALLLQTNSTDGSFPLFLVRTNGSASALTNFPAIVLQTNSSLSVFPLGLLRTNGDGSALTNLPNANLSNAIGILPLSNGGTGSTNESAARAALGLGTAATNPASAFQPASSALTNLAAGDAAGLTNLPNADLGTATGVLGIANGGSAATNQAGARTNFGLVWSGLTNTDDAGFRAALSLGTAATNPATAFQPASTNLDALANNNGGSLTNVSVDLTAVLPSYSGNDGKVLAVATGGTNVEWTAISNTVTDASLLTNFPSIILQTNSAETNFPSFLLRTNGTFAFSNTTGTVEVARGGTGATNASGARSSILPSYSANANKVLAVNSGATDVEWITQGASSGSSGTRMGPFQYDLEATSTNGALGGGGSDWMNGWLVQASLTNGSYYVNRTWLPIFGIAATRFSYGSIYDIALKFSEPFKFGMHLGTTGSNTMVGNSRAYVGTSDSYTNGDPTGVTIGWRLQTNTIFAAMHNGTSYSEPFSTNNVLSETNWSWVWCWVEGNGNGTVTWYVNGEELGSVTNGPTTDAAGSMLSIVSHNDTGTNLGAATLLRVQNFKADFGQ